MALTLLKTREQRGHAKNNGRETAGSDIKGNRTSLSVLTGEGRANNTHLRRLHGQAQRWRAATVIRRVNMFSSQWTFLTCSGA